TRSYGDWSSDVCSSDLKLLRFKEEIGADPGFVQHGYLFVARSPKALEELREAQRVQHACGLRDAQMISAGEARAINPAIGDDARSEERRVGKGWRSRGC